MTTYVVVAARRIQTWLVRTPELRLMRGASRALDVLSDPSTPPGRSGPDPGRRGLIDTLGLAERVEVEPTAGQVSGVVPLRLKPGASPEEVAWTVLEHLAVALPGLDWEAWWQEAADYPMAYRQNEQSSAGPQLQLTGAPYEATMARACSGCRREPGIAWTAEERQKYSSITDVPAILGLDCRARWAHRSRRDDGKPLTFDQLARTAGRGAAVGRHLSSNHLATIVVDGNKIGDTFDALHELDKTDGGHRAETASPALGAAVVAALSAALTDAQPKEKGLRVIEHYVGGDDVFISVPARAAWSYVAALAATFPLKFAEGCPDVPTPSLGIGMVFANASHPVAQTHARAEEALRLAKRAVSGERSALSWLDLTETDELPPSRHVTLEELQVDLQQQGREPTRDWMIDLRQSVLEMDGSRRSTLNDWLRRPGVPLRTAARELREWAERVGEKALVEALPKDADDQRVEAVLAVLRDCASRARWWPAEAREGAR